ncbi:MAG: hypothetical protein ACTHL7_08690 [Steroidobacteraceae bacterium]
MLRELRLTATGLVLSVALAGCGGGSEDSGGGEPPPPALSAKALAVQALFFDTSLSGFDPNNPTAYHVPAQCAPGTE